MTIVLETSSNDNFGASDTTIIVDKPTGTVSGDVLAACMHHNGTQNATPPSGWVVVDEWDPGQNRWQGWYYLVAGASEPSTYTFDFGSSVGSREYWCGRFSGVDTTTPIDVGATRNADFNQTTYTALSVTTVNANAFLLTGCALNAAGGAQTSSDLTERYDGGDVLYVTGDIQAGAGASGNKQGTYTNTVHYGAIMFALKEEAADTGPQVNISPGANYVQVI